MRVAYKKVHTTGLNTGGADEILLYDQESMLSDMNEM